MRTINLFYVKVFVNVLLLTCCFASCSSPVDKVTRQRKSEGCAIVNQGETFLFYYNDSALCYENLDGSIVRVIDFTKEYEVESLWPIIGDSVSIYRESYINGWFIDPSKCKFKAIQDWGILVTEFESGYTSIDSRLFLVSKPQLAYRFGANKWQKGNVQIKKDYICLTLEDDLFCYGQFAQDVYYNKGFPPSIIEPELENRWLGCQRTETPNLFRYYVKVHLLPNGKIDLKDYCEVGFPYMFKTYSYSDIVAHKELFDIKEEMLKYIGKFGE